MAEVVERALLVSHSEREDRVKKPKGESLLVGMNNLDDAVKSIGVGLPGYVTSFHADIGCRGVIGLTPAALCGMCKLVKPCVTATMADSLCSAAVCGDCMELLADAVKPKRMAHAAS